MVANSLPVFARLLLSSPGSFVALCAAAAADGLAAALAGRAGAGDAPPPQLCESRRAWTGST